MIVRCHNHISYIQTYRFVQQLSVDGQYLNALCYYLITTILKNKYFVILYYITFTFTYFECSILSYLQQIPLKLHSASALDVQNHWMIAAVKLIMCMSENPRQNVWLTLVLNLFQLLALWNIFLLILNIKVNCPMNCWCDLHIIWRLSLHVWLNTIVINYTSTF